MSDTTTDPTDETRPWHGTDNPLEAMYQWFTAEIAALKAKLAPPTEDVPVEAPPAPVAVEPPLTPVEEAQVHEAHTDETPAT